jgi:hypothetical protein
LCNRKAGAKRLGGKREIPFESLFKIAPVAIDAALMGFEIGFVG